MTQGLEKWLELSPPAREAMQQAAQRCFNNRFRIDRVAESLVRIIQTHVPAALDSQAQPAIKKTA